MGLNPKGNNPEELGQWMKDYIAQTKDSPPGASKVEQTGVRQDVKPKIPPLSLPSEGSSISRTRSVTTLSPTAENSDMEELKGMVQQLVSSVQQQNAPQQYREEESEWRYAVISQEEQSDNNSNIIGESQVQTEADQDPGETQGDAHSSRDTVSVEEDISVRDSTDSSATQNETNQEETPDN
uniref:Uncharacterized protein n=1 Tax=Magallana gigas TaxID=29159 RepID=A0A8W8NPX9_MAGGI